MLDGIKAADPSATVNYADGCANFTVTDPCNETTDFSQAVTAAQNSAVTVVVVGEPSGDVGEASSLSDIDLPGQQLALIQADRRHRQAVRGGADERTPADHPVAGG